MPSASALAMKMFALANDFEGQLADIFSLHDAQF